MTTTSDEELRQMAALLEKREAMNARKRETMQRVDIAVDDALTGIPQHTPPDSPRLGRPLLFARGESVAEVRRLAGEAATNVDTDLTSYFDSLPHSGLLKSVARRVVDGALLHLIKMWLEGPVQETLRLPSLAASLPEPLPWKLITWGSAGIQ